MPIRFDKGVYAQITLKNEIDLKKLVKLQFYAE